MASKDAMLEALLDSFTPLDSTSPDIKAMIYGASGVGKTVAAVQLAQEICPTGKYILYIDAVEGWVSLKNHKGLTTNVRRMVYKGIAQIEFLADMIKEGNENVKDIGVIVFDEYSTMMKMDLDIVLAARAKKDSTKDPDVPTMPDFGVNTARFKRATYKILPLACHLIFVAHQRIDRDNTGIERISPAFMPKFSETIKENLHLSAHMTSTMRMKDDVEVYVRKMQVYPSIKVDAKTRVGGLEVFESPESLCSKITAWQSSGDSAGVQELVNDIPVANDDTDDPAIITE